MINGLRKALGMSTAGLCATLTIAATIVFAYLASSNTIHKFYAAELLYPVVYSDKEISPQKIDNYMQAMAKAYQSDAAGLSPPRIFIIPESALKSLAGIDAPLSFAVKSGVFSYKIYINGNLHKLLTNAAIREEVRIFLETNNVIMPAQ